MDIYLVKTIFNEYAWSKKQVYVIHILSHTYIQQEHVRGRVGVAGTGYGDWTQRHTYCKVKYWVLIQMQSSILLSFLYWEVF